MPFEPDPYIFQYLVFNLHSFGFKDVAIFQKGLWEANTSLLFESDGADAGFLNNNYNKKLTPYFKKVPVISLKSYLNKHVDFLKLDIEGAETKVLTDIQDELKNVERIFVEYHSFINQQQTLDTVISILSRAKFRLYITSPSLLSPSPFSKIKTYKNMDLQLNIFGYRQ